MQNYGQLGEQNMIFLKKHAKHAKKTLKNMKNMLTGHAAMAQNAFGSSTMVGEHFEIYYLTQKVLPLRFQRAINHIPKLNKI